MPKKWVLALLVAVNTAAGGAMTHQTLASKDKVIEIKGRVLRPDGKPIAGAKVYVSTYSYKDRSDPKKRLETDAEGRFRFLCRPEEVEYGETMIAAVAPGYGPDWAPLTERGELTLRLADDMPVKGRVLDLEGRPIAGATVRLKRLWKMPSEALSEGLKQLQTKPKDRRDSFSRLYHKYKGVLSSVWGVLDVPKNTKTGADGRFQFRGLGRDRIAEIRIEGPNIEYRTLTVVVRPGLAENLPRDLYGPAFDYPAAPSKPIRGSVREKGTGKLLAGIRVGCQAASGDESSEAFTDKRGHYEIPGVRKSDQYILNLGYRNPPYINYSKNVEDTPALGPITADFEMERALTLCIRVTEKGNGKPVRGSIGYEVGRDNSSLSRFTTFPRNTRSADGNEKDGCYKQTVLPGPGYIVFRATKDAYARVRIKGSEKDHYLGGVLLSPIMLGLYHAVVPINPSAKDPQSLICNIVLERGRTLAGTVIDPEGRPLPGALAWGTTAVMGEIVGREYYGLATASFTATGLDPHYPRTLIFYHTEKKLARAQWVRGDEKGPLTARLQPLGMLAGRVVDASGRPQPGLTVSLSFEQKQTRTLPEEHIFGNSSLNSVLLGQRATTDKDGRFRMEGLVSGLKYDLNVGRGKDFTWSVRKDLSGKPGATVDIGEIQLNARHPPGAETGTKQIGSWASKDRTFADMDCGAARRAFPRSAWQRACCGNSWVYLSGQAATF